VIQLAPGGLQGTLSDAEAAALRERFDREHCFKIERFLAAETMAKMRRFIDEVPFVHRDHGDIGSELCLPDSRGVRLMFFLVNDPALFAIIQRLTGCPRIGCFTGRIYRMVPGSGDSDTWHSDALNDRMIGMSINLGDAYDGGVFQMRERASKRPLGELPNVVPGDAILFRIDDRLQHCISPMTGTAPKTAFAGWFRSAPEFLSLIDRGGEAPASEPPW
jgi:hypothetical protein